MFEITLCIFILIIWIGNLILRMQVSYKNVKGNIFQILMAVFFIIFAIVNITKRAVNLKNNVSDEFENSMEIVSSDAEFIQDEYYIMDEVY